jgi:Na+/H+-dicarboxylate symporter
MKKLALHWKILLGMAMGVLVAIVLIQFPFGKSLAIDWIKPFGNIFINALKVIAVPLILASLIKGVTDLKDISKLSKMGFKTIGIYLLTTVIAVSIGLVMVNILQPGDFLEQSTKQELLKNFESEAQSKIEMAENQKSQSPLKAIEDIVPSNIVKAASDNGNMLQVIFFAILMGIGLILIPQEKAKPLIDFFDSLNELPLTVDLFL